MGLKLAGAVVLRSGRIIDSNVMVELHDDCVDVYASSFCEVTSNRDLHYIIPLSEVKFITSWGFNEPYLYGDREREFKSEGRFA